MTRLILIRHGETEHNTQYRICGWTESDLSPRGRAQVQALGRYLAESERLDGIYSSPLRRAWETALHIARPHQLDPQPVDGLREMYFGEVEGLTVEEFRRRYPDFHAKAQAEDDLSFAWPGGESRGAFYARVLATGQRLAAENPGRTIAAVSHGGFISVFLAAMLEGKPWKWRDFSVANCAVSILRFENGRVVPERINDTSFLDVPSQLMPEIGRR